MTTEKNCFERKENACNENSARQFAYKSRQSSLRFSPFLCPDLGEDQKKVFIQIQPVFLPRFSAQIEKGGGHDSIMRTILRYLCITGTPKGGAMAQWPPLNTPP